MRREHFVFTIGYQDDQAIVDKSLVRAHKNLSTMDLYQQGLLKNAVASAVYAKEVDGDDSDMNALVRKMREDFSEDLNETQLRRSFGITTDPTEDGAALLV